MYRSRNPAARLGGAAGPDLDRGRRPAVGGSGPGGDLAERRLRLRRALATLLVFLLFLVALAGILTVFVRPLATEGRQFIDRLPSYMQDAHAGRGPVGGLIQRYNLDQYLERNQSRLQESTNRITEPALGVLRSIFSTVVALATIFVLTFLMVLQGPKLLQSWIAGQRGEGFGVVGGSWPGGRNARVAVGETGGAVPVSSRPASLV